MPIETNLNVAPYFDDFSPDSNYHKILFRPGVALQARELTQLQSILQNQIERFGDNVYKSGTIISGVNFSYNFKYNYVKLLDLQVDGQPALPSSYVDLYAKNSSNLISRIVNYKNGFQSRDPETNYIYLNYINSGDDSSSTTYTPGEVLTIYSDAYQLYDFNVVNGGTNFSNSDAVQITSALIVANSTIGTGNVTQSITGSQPARLSVIESNTTFGTITQGSVTYSSTQGYTLLKVRPTNSDLANTNLTPDNWNIKTGYNIVQGSNSAYVVAKVGSGASATLTTDGSGIISDVSIISPGSDYDILPYITVRTSAGVLTNLNIIPFNYKAQVTIADETFTASSTTPVGKGYAFSVTSGVIYQKGNFIQVNPQTVIVNTYSTFVDNTTVGFETIESVVNSNIDETLLDVATGTPNYSAPGANRLKLTPTLKVVNSADIATNNTFMPLVEFKRGYPGKEHSSTKFNSIAKEMETRTREASGNYVLDTFVASTKDRTPRHPAFAEVVVDPGAAYIDGSKVQTKYNTYLNLRAGIDTSISSNRDISLNYGNYVYVNEYYGYFKFEIGDQIDLYDTSLKRISKADTQSLGSKIGTARVRSVVHDNGNTGTSYSVYRVYLFDVQMDPGKSFKQVRNLYSSTTLASADIVIETNPQTGSLEAILHDNKFNALIFPVGLSSIRSANSINYSYRTTETITDGIATDGKISTAILSGNTYTYYGASANLNTQQLRDIIIIPSVNTTSNVNTSIVVQNGNNIITGTSLSVIYGIGDTIKITNDSNTDYYYVTGTVNSTAVTITKFDGSNSVYANTSNTTAWSYKHYPDGKPIPMDNGIVTANTDSNNNRLFINLGTTFSSTSNVIVSYNISRNDASATTKSIKRNLYVKIQLTSNNLEGPWNLGIPDAFRLNNVHIGGAGVNAIDPKITRYFYIDNGQTDSYYGHAKLVKKYNSNYVLQAGDYLLVDFDAFDAVEGFTCIESYAVNNDSDDVNDFGNTSISILEIPEFISSQNQYIDLIDAIDFRPRVSNTAIYTSVPGSATVNPSNTITFTLNDKKFPVPDSRFTATYEHFLARKDIVTLDSEGTMRVVEGTSSVSNLQPPRIPSSVMAIGSFIIPPYPSLPSIPSGNTAYFAAKNVGTGKVINTRALLHTIGEIDLRSSGLNQQNRRYTMKDVGNIDKRLQAVEYYTSLNLLEKSTKDLLIPSGIDGTNRFKNGFFVDQFNDYKQADLSNPEFHAQINQTKGALYPVETSYNLQARLDYTDDNVKSDSLGRGELIEPGIDQLSETEILLPFVEELIVQQTSHTDIAANSNNSVELTRVGTMSINPNTFKVLFTGEIAITGTEVVGGGGIIRDEIIYESD